MLVCPSCVFLQVEMDGQGCLSYRESMDIRTALKQGLAQLRAVGVPSHTLAAEMLLLHVLGRDRTWIYAHPEEEISPADVRRFLELIGRRSSGEPTQHLTGKQEFWSLGFEVAPAVSKHSAPKACKSPTSAPVPAASRWPSQKSCPAQRFTPRTFRTRPSPSPAATPRATPSPIKSISSNPICSMKPHTYHVSST